MFIALEGSAPTISGGNTELNADYRNYYVQRALRLAAHPKMYHRGPAMGSIGASRINIRVMADAATSFIAANSGKVFMVGWSRGAAACIQAAYDLKRSGGKRVDAMFLFDPVDMDTSTDDNLDYIPDSVISVYHATATDKNWFWSRVFPTCGKTQAPGVRVTRASFNTSHSGIAGGPDGDHGSWDWMKNHMLNNGVFRI